MIIPALSSLRSPRARHSDLHRVIKMLNTTLAARLAEQKETWDTFCACFLSVSEEENAFDILKPHQKNLASFFWTSAVR